MGSQASSSPYVVPVHVDGNSKEIAMSAVVAVHMDGNDTHGERSRGSQGAARSGGGCCDGGQFVGGRGGLDSRQPGRCTGAKQRTPATAVVDRRLRRTDEVVEDLHEPLRMVLVREVS